MQVYKETGLFYFGRVEPKSILMDDPLYFLLRAALGIFSEGKERGHLIKGVYGTKEKPR